MNVVNKKPNLAMAKRLLKASNAGLVNVEVKWGRKPALCQDFNNAYWWSSDVIVSADGYKPKRMMLSVDWEGCHLR